MESCRVGLFLEGVVLACYVPMGSRETERRFRVALASEYARSKPGVQRLHKVWQSDTSALPQVPRVF